MTSAGRAALVADGHVPRPQAPSPAGLFD
jgi:hypothetical protein